MEPWAPLEPQQNLNGSNLLDLLLQLQSSGLAIGERNGSQASLLRFALDERWMAVYRDLCARSDPANQDPKLKFALVVVVGTSLAVVSGLENALILWLFASRPHFRISHLFYFSVLAALDVLLSISYVLLMSVQALMVYYSSSWLASYWYWYLRALFTASLVFITASNYLIVAATFERFSTSASLNRFEFSQRRRVAAVVLIAVLAVLFRGSTYFEFHVLERNCPDHLRYQASPTSLVGSFWYGKVWMLCVRSSIVVLLPFVAVAYLNARIVRSLKSEQGPKGLRSALLFATVGEKVAKERKASVRAATRMLILVAFSYLFANLLNVVVVTWDNLHSRSLRVDHPFFYSISADVISLSKIISSAMRLPIYAWCNRKVRAEVRVVLRRVAHSLCWPLYAHPHKPSDSREDSVVPTDPAPPPPPTARSDRSSPCLRGNGNAAFAYRGESKSLLSMEGSSALLTTESSAALLRDADLSTALNSIDLRFLSVRETFL